MNKINTKVIPLKEKRSGLGKREWDIIKHLSTPQKIQDYLNKLPFNFEERGETYMSVKRSIKAKKAHCFEGALIAAAALWARGEKPLLLDLKTDPADIDHVVVLFRRFGAWGAISKTNHSVLRYREPVYENIRELAMSYFHEYFLESGHKTLRSYSEPFDLSKLGTRWLTDEAELGDIVTMLDHSKHHEILTREQIKGLRKADKLEIKASQLAESKPKKS